MKSSLELSVIVPVLNEAEGIVPFLLMLARQEGVDFEVILSDGGSTDATEARAKSVAGNCPFPLRLLRGERGRARQMNRGAVAAKGEWLLFLHADSGFPDTAALRTGISTLREAVATTGHGRTAGRFALRFDLAGKTSPFGYYFCIGKSRLNRPGCILGDQGFLLSQEFFGVVGPFDESLPVAEDVDLAERIRARGSFLLLPAEIHTSPRRFETEGYRARQTLNALLMGLLFSGHSHFLTALPGIYRPHDAGHRLHLEPFFREIASMIALLPVREQLAFWHRIGTYVRANAWQLAYALDVRRTWRRGMTVGNGDAPLLARYDRYLDRMTDHPPGRLLTAGVVWVWFQLAQRWPRLREGIQEDDKREDEKRAGR